MYLYVDIQPATVDGQYKLTVSTDISWDGNFESAPIDRYLNIVGPRFSLDPTLVANVYPPRNGQGAFQDAIPQIVLSRRTLPWERAAGLPAPVVDPSLPAQNGQVPWIALLLFQDGEPYSLLQNQHLVDVVGTAAFQKLGWPANVLCDAVEVDRSLLMDILPTSHELRLLSHVRQVNVEDRELSAGSSDGFFSVVMSNRLPSPETKYRACLVSLEQRADLLQALHNAPPGFVDVLPALRAAPAATREFGIIGRGPGILIHPTVGWFCCTRGNSPVPARVRSRG
jgi:hypothetical protein